MNQEVSVNSMEPEGVSISGMLFWLKSAWRWLAGGSVVGVLLAALYLLICTPLYQATAFVQPGRLLGNEVEPIAQLLERLKIPTFYTDEIVGLCKIEGSDPKARLAKAIKPRLIKNNAILQLEYLSPNRVEAEICLEGVVALIEQQESVRSKSVLLNAKNQLELNKKQLLDAEKYYG